MNSQLKIFRSRISILLLIIIFLILIFTHIPMFKYSIITGIISFIVILSFISFLLTGIKYIISDKTLYIKIWGINMATINIMEIYSVKRSYNPLSSPASSLKRLKLSLNKDFALISPAKEEKFINELSNRNPDIKVFVPKKNELIRVWDWDI